MALANCVSCGAMNGLGNGLGLLQVSELGQIGSSALSTLGNAAPPAGAAIGVAQGAAMGALIGGLSAWSGKAALTGALIGGAWSGIVGGATIGIGSIALAQSQQIDPTTGKAISVQTDPGFLTSLRVTSIATLGVGVGLGIWAAARIYKQRRRGG